jgi:hypothetical protein
LLWSNSGTARIGFQPADVWQFSHGIVNGPCGLRVPSRCADWAVCTDAVEGTLARIPGAGNARRAQNTTWSSVSVSLSHPRRCHRRGACTYHMAQIRPKLKRYPHQIRAGELCRVSQLCPGSYNCTNVQMKNSPVTANTHPSRSAILTLRNAPPMNIAKPACICCASGLCTLPPRVTSVFALGQTPVLGCARRK